MRPWTNRTVILAVIGMTLLVLGVAAMFLWPVLFNHILSQELPITPTSRVLDLWRSTGDKIPLNMEFYFFNWTNPEELKIPGKKPNLVEVGPYTFIHKTEKVNITFHPENGTVSYFVRKYWYFDPHKSNGTLNDTLVQLNVLAVAAANKVRYWDEFYQSTVSIILGQVSSIHIVKTVDEMMFTGFKDQLIDLGKLAMDTEDMHIPAYDRFGWFYLRNGSTFFDGHYNVATGEDDIANLGIMKKWNYTDVTDYYKSPCNVVEGSAGEFFPPGRDTDDITAFAADLCRPMIYEYVGKATHHGITGYKYELGEKSLGNSSFRRYPHSAAKYFERTTTTEDFFHADYSTKKSAAGYSDPDVVDMGKCYCNGECSPVGVINITACRYGAPGFISLPHFHKADPILREQVNGLNPNEKDHSFYYLLEPNTGVPIDVAARLQVNILLQPYDFVTLFRDVPKIYFPCFWFSMRAGTTEDLASSLRMLLLVPSIGLYSSIIVAIVGGIVLLILAVIQYSQKGRSHPKNSKLKRHGWVSNNDSKEKRSEHVYMDTTTTPDDNERTDRQLYPTLN
ncbi:protein croquemort [Fopius arisanus]|uniref:Protein croquemort n=1 Tax=Fopius arisanus TaxID=64838 RepID=A0A9R1TU26_9HYME|nr:PREDICTED: protein croquemort [Fopius arisanus]